MNNKPNNVDEYIANFPPNVQDVLESVRSTIRKAAPAAEECISYAMPTFKMGKSAIVHFAGYENHIGLYPAPVGMEAFKKELSVYKTGKGSVQFPLDQPIPLSLITKIVKFRVVENKERLQMKKK